MLLEYIYKDYWGQQSAKEASNQQNYIPSYSPGYGEFKKVCFVSIAWMVSVSPVFVYNAVDVNKLRIAFLTKQPP